MYDFGSPGAYRPLLSQGLSFESFMYKALSETERLRLSYSFIHFVDNRSVRSVYFDCLPRQYRCNPTIRHGPHAIHRYQHLESIQSFSDQSRPVALRRIGTLNGQGMP